CRTIGRRYQLQWGTSSGFERTTRDLEPEHAIAFELRFREELICRRFVRECGVGHGIAEHVHRLSAMQARLQIEEQAVRAFAVGVVVSDAADCPIGLLRRGGRALLETLLETVQSVHFNAHAEVDPYLSERIPKIIEHVVRIANGITNDD